MADIIPAVTDTDFQEKVVEASKKGPVLVDVWAPWCAPCLKMAPIVEGLAKDRVGQLTVTKLDLGEGRDAQGNQLPKTNQKTAQDYKVEGLPTVILFMNGKEADRLTGLHNKHQLDEFLNKHISAQPTTIPAPRSTAPASAPPTVGRTPIFLPLPQSTATASIDMMRTYANHTEINLPGGYRLAGAKRVNGTTHGYDLPVQDAQGKTLSYFFNAQDANQITVKGTNAKGESVNQTLGSLVAGITSQQATKGPTPLAKTPPALPLPPADALDAIPKTPASPPPLKETSPETKAAPPVAKRRKLETPPPIPEATRTPAPMPPTSIPEVAPLLPTGPLTADKAPQIQSANPDETRMRRKPAPTTQPYDEATPSSPSAAKQVPSAPPPTEPLNEKLGEAAELLRKLDRGTSYKPGELNLIPGGDGNVGRYELISLLSNIATSGTPYAPDIQKVNTTNRANLRSALVALNYAGTHVTLENLHAAARHAKITISGKDAQELVKLLNTSDPAAPVPKKPDAPQHNGRPLDPATVATMSRSGLKAAHSASSTVSTAAKQPAPASDEKMANKQLKNLTPTLSS